MKQLGKRGFVKMNPDIVKNAIYGLLVIMLLFEVSAVIFPQVQSSAGTLCNSGIPFASFFRDNGIVIMMIVITLILVVLTAVGIGGKKR